MPKNIYNIFFLEMERWQKELERNSERYRSISGTTKTRSPNKIYPIMKDYVINRILCNNCDELIFLIVSEDIYTKIDKRMKKRKLDNERSATYYRQKSNTEKIRSCNRIYPEINDYVVDQTTFTSKQQINK